MREAVEDFPQINQQNIKVCTIIFAFALFFDHCYM